MSIIVIFLLALIFLVFIILKIKIKYTHWNRRKVKGPKPEPIFGNLKPVFLLKQSIDDVLAEIYTKYENEKVVGTYFGLRPVLLIRDPELVKHVLVKDFDSFRDRGMPVAMLKRHNKHLGMLNGDEWKSLRQQLTPIFTVKKLKEMIPLIVQCTIDFNDYVGSLLETGEKRFDTITLASKVSMDTVASCIFGLKVDSLTADTFTDIANLIDDPPLWKKLLLMLETFWYGITQRVLAILPHQKIDYFFTNLVGDIIRKKKGKLGIRKDFIDHMLEIKTKGQYKRKGHNSLESEIEINDLIISQTFLFFAASSIPARNIIGSIFYQLAHHKEAQDRLYEEIRNSSQKNDGVFSYDTIREMEYLRMILNEVKRINGGTYLRRVATSDYVLPEVNLLIEKGTSIVIPSAMSFDSKYFTDPGEFNPENFSQQNVMKRHPFAFLPFGNGPRNCIGKSFGELQISLCIIEFLLKFKLKPYSETKESLRFDPINKIRIISNDLFVTIEKR